MYPYFHFGLPVLVHNANLSLGDDKKECFGIVSLPSTFFTVLAGEGCLSLV